MFNYTKDGELNISKIIVHSVLAILVLVVIFGSFRIVSAGHRGVMLTMGAVGDKTFSDDTKCYTSIYKFI